MVRAFVVAGLGFGDEGKGTIVDYLVRHYNASVVVRYNGGPQAGHRVVAPDGREHVFAQFGSGSFVPGVRTHLSRYTLVNPLNLYRENEHLVEIGVVDALDLLTIDANCVIVTPFHVAANRIRELARGNDRHGSCGQGVGEARHDALSGIALQAGAINTPAGRRALAEIQDAKWILVKGLLNQIPPGDTRDAAAEEAAVLVDPDAVEMTAERYRPLAANVVSFRYLAQLVASGGTAVFEGAQGVLLDERHGRHPHTTWTNTTYGNAIRVLDEAGIEGFESDVQYIGVIRAYATRHGAGPFPSESVAMTRSLRDVAGNTNDPWQGSFRVGHFDLPLLKYALRHVRPDEIALTCLDRIEDQTAWLYAADLDDPRGDVWESSRVYRSLEPSAVGYRALFEREGLPPIRIASYGTKATDKSVAWRPSEPIGILAP